MRRSDYLIVSRALEETRPYVPKGTTPNSIMTGRIEQWQATCEALADEFELQAPAVFDRERFLRDCGYSVTPSGS